MRLFGRRPPKPKAGETELAADLAVIRRIKVTIDRYWVTSERQIPDEEQTVEELPEKPVEPTLESGNANDEPREDPHEL